MGGLSHFIEQEGVPTTGISLIREHTEAIKPPRALWVPFDLGRPLGVPNDAAFQTRVLTAALELLDAPAGPVLADFPEDAPASATGPAAWACPVNFSAPAEEQSAADQLRATFTDEVAQLGTWYDLAVKARDGRTTLGSSSMQPEQLAGFIGGFLGGGLPDSPRDDLPVGLAFKLAAEDLKAYYCEAVTAQPGHADPGAEDLAHWFWWETTGGKVLRTVRESCMSSDDNLGQMVGAMMLVPMAQVAKGA